MKKSKRILAAFVAAAALASPCLAVFAAESEIETALETAAELEAEETNAQAEYAASAAEGALDAAVTYFVATDGNDSNPGSIEAPFATVDKARDTIRELKKTKGLPKGGVTVYLRGGTYARSTSLEFTEEDSGTEDARITYMSYPGERAEITGGVYISGRDFKPVTDTDVLERFYPHVRDKIVCVNLKDYGVTNLGTWYNDGKEMEAWELAGETLSTAVPGLMVFADDTPLDIARVPNRIASGENEGMWDYFRVGAKSKIKAATSTRGAIFQYTDDRIETWKTYEDVAVYGFWNTSWKFESSQILSVNKNDKTITLKHPLSSGPVEGRRYIYLNVLEELDSDTEYYIDKNTGMLYMYARENLAKERIGVTQFGMDSNKDFLVHLKEASNLTFSGLNITLARTTGVRLNHCENNLFYDCDIKNMGRGAYAIGGYSRSDLEKYTRGMNHIYSSDYMNNVSMPISREEYVNKYKTYNNGIVNSRLMNTGASAIFINGGDILECERGENYIENCDISHTNLYESDLGGAIKFYGVGNTVRGCSIHHNPNQAIGLAGNENIIEYNELYNNCIDNSDMGVIYSAAWNNNASFDTEIRYNYFHDTPNTIYTTDELVPQDGVAHRHSIYNDYCEPVQEVHHNIFVNMPSGLYNGGGADNNWRDNIFVDVLHPMRVFLNINLRAAINSGGDIFSAPCLTSFNNPIFTENEKFKERYPQYEEVRQKYLEWGTSGILPASDITGNVMVWYNQPEYFSTALVDETANSNGGLEECSLERCNIENNLYTKSDPGFVDIDGGDYRWKADAKIFQTHPEMKKIDVSRMGYQKSEYADMLKENLIMKLGSSITYKFGEASLVDSENTEVKPFIENGSTLVPVRFISESFGARVDYDDAQKLVKITLADKEVTLKIGENKINVNGDAKTMDVAADIYKGRTFIPLRAVTEALGKEVFWDNRGLIIISEQGNSVDAEKDKVIINKVLEYNYR